MKQEKDQEVEYVEQQILPSKLDLEDFGFHYIYGAIDESTSLYLTQFIHKHELLFETKEVNIYINSVGGNLTDSWSITNLLMNSSLTINTYAMGQICSGGTMIFLAGDVRFMQKNSIWMSHQHSGGYYGKHHEIEATVEYHKNSYNDLINYYKKRTKLRKKLIVDKLLGHSDHYLTAKECLELKLCDELV